MALRHHITGIVTMIDASIWFWLAPLLPMLRYLLTRDADHWGEAMGRIRRERRRWHDGLVTTVLGRRAE